jgi:hypothetical protein
MLVLDDYIRRRLRLGGCVPSYAGGPSVGLDFRGSGEPSQLLPWGKMRNAVGINFYNFTSLRVAASISSAVTRAKRSEAPKLDTTAVDQMLGDPFEKSGYNALNLPSRKLWMLGCQQ